MLNLAFLSPLFLMGIATAAIPVIIHLIHRRKARQTPFSTLRFLRMSHHRTAHRRRLHELLLLAMRCIILIALAVILYIFAVISFIRSKRNPQQ